MIPTSANSAETRKTGLCFAIRVESSFSRCSGARLARAARDGAASALSKEDTTAGVKAEGNRLWIADII